MLIVLSGCVLTFNYNKGARIGPPLTNEEQVHAEVVYFFFYYKG